MELKFRAWNEENSEMVYFDADKMSCDTYIAGHFINLLGRGLLEQFTGLTDKNGKDIYCGDRVKVWNGNKSFIGHDGFQFTVGKQQRRMDANEAIDMEVIGNIYE